MNRNLAIRGALIIGVVAFFAYVAYPPNETINLGLDLKGGIQLVLEVRVEDAWNAETNKAMERILGELRDKGLSQADGTQDNVNQFRVRGITRDQESVVRQAADDFLPNWGMSRTGDVLVFSRESQEISAIREEAIVQALQTIRNRVDEFGVAEPVIQRQGIGGNRIVLQLPGVDDPERVKRLIQSTALLEFRLVDFPMGGNGASSVAEIMANYDGRLPDHLEIGREDVRDRTTHEVVGQRYYALEKRQVVTGRDLDYARPGRGQLNEPVVEFRLKREGAVRFGEVTGQNVGRGLAILLDGKVESAPRINSRITSSGIIEGTFTQQEVEDLSMVLRSGSLPASIEYLEERSVGPSLGQDSIDQGVRAAVIGGMLVILAMLVVYKGTGVNAVVALVLNAVLVMGALAYFGASLTLPGIAGLILTIGMAVDANVLIFERIREELRSGRTVKSAVAAGFSKALSSILDANVTTLIAAMFLFNFGTGPIRGFAVTLSVGILASILTAVVNSRWIFDVILARRVRVERLSI